MVVQITDGEKLRRIGTAWQFIKQDPTIKEIMDQANAESVKAKQVFHGYPHALDVTGLTGHVIDGTESVVPGTFGEYLRRTAETAAMLHDVGRAFGVLPYVGHSDSRNHAVSGAIFALEYLKRLSVSLFGDEKALSPLFQQRVSYNVRNHRAEMWLGANRHRRFNGPDTPALIVADKASGSENKVPSDLLALMQQLAAVPVPPELKKAYRLDHQWTMARINWNSPASIHEPLELINACGEIIRAAGIEIPEYLEVDDHFRINGAIKDRMITIFPDEVPSEPHFKGTLMVQMTVDERLAPRALVTGEREWWNDAWHVVALASGYLRLRLLLEFNGTVFRYSKQADDWLPATSFNA